MLPIGGPGEAITPRQQGERLFALLGCTPRFRQVPVALLDGIVGVLGTAGRVVPALARKAELARIGRYYATESMLVLDPATGRYDAAATPSTGSQTLLDHYAALLNGAAAPERGDHAVFCPAPRLRAESARSGRKQFMAAQPLSHHEILALVEPFTRRGRRVDLAASDRLARRLAFAPVEHETPALHESLALEHPGPGELRLTRTLRDANGVPAALVCDAGDAAEALAAIESVEPARQFRSGAGWSLGLSYRIEPRRGAALKLMQAQIQVERLSVAVEVLETRGTPADVRISADAADTIALPDDLLAVLGWGWGRLERRGEAWHASVDLRGDPFARSREAEAKLERMAVHLAQTLAEPPARFHERFAAARWWVTLRRAMPVLIGVALIAGSFGISKVAIAQESLVRMLALNAPPLLLLLFFCQRELPRFEIPPLPRRLSAPAWRRETPEG